MNPYLLRSRTWHSTTKGAQLTQLNTKHGNKQRNAIRMLGSAEQGYDLTHLTARQFTLLRQQTQPKVYSCEPCLHLSTMSK